MHKSPGFLLFVRDWLSDERVSLMSPAAQGHLVTLMCHGWLEGSISTSPTVLARLLRVELEDFKPRWREIEPLWVRRETPLGPRYFHPRLEEERARQHAYSDKQSRRASGRARESRQYQLPGVPRSPLSSPKPHTQAPCGSGLHLGEISSPADSLAQAAAVAQPRLSRGPAALAQPITSTSTSSPLTPPGETADSPAGPPPAFAPGSSEWEALKERLRVNGGAPASAAAVVPPEGREP